MVTFWYKLRVNQAWKFKAPIIMSAIYLVILNSKNWVAFPYLILSFCTIIGIAGIGYISNDLGDRQSDKKAGKANFFNQTSRLIAIVASILLLTLAIGPWFFFPTTKWTVLLIGGQFLAFVVYGLPPFRLKRSVFVAPFLDALYAHVIPVALAAYTFMLITDQMSLTFLGLLATWQLLFGVRAFINHLYLDRANDLLSYPTIATRGGAHVWRKVLFVVSIVEFSLLLIIVWFYTSFWVVGLLLAIAIAILPSSFTFYSFRVNVTDNIFVIFFPIVLLLLGCFEKAEFWWVLPIHLILFPSIFELKWVGSLLVKIREWVSYLANHAIYFFRRFVLWQSDKKARREYYQGHLTEMVNKEKTQAHGSITLVNLNKNKYSETFIHHYKNELICGVDFLYGGYPPHFDEAGNSLGKGDIDSLNLAVAKRVGKTRSRLILAHFGPMAVSMMPIAQITGVPLVVYFHAYDVHHEKQLSAYQDQYIELFKCAHLLLASSQEIVQKLLKLGAPEAKIKYLPAFFSVDKFLRIEREVEPLKVLAIGRFADTKSPHILLLAFTKVLEKMPEARLTFIGEGELLESSIMMSRALKIDDRIVFCGSQTPEEVLGHLTTAQVFVQHSATTPIFNDKEGTPVAIMEAMSAGLPIVSTRHAGIQELIIHEENGILVDELDIEGMSKGIARCLTSPQLCEKMGANAQQSIRDNPLIMNHMEIISEIIEDYGLRI